MLRDKEIDLENYGLEYIAPDPVFHMPFWTARTSPSGSIRNARAPVRQDQQKDGNT